MQAFICKIRAYCRVLFNKRSIKYRKKTALTFTIKHPIGTVQLTKSLQKWLDLRDSASMPLHAINNSEQHYKRWPTILYCLIKYCCINLI